MVLGITTRMVALLSLVLLVFSCEDQVASVSLTGNSENSLAYVGEVTSFKGEANNVEKVEVFLDGSFLETLVVSNGRFSFDRTFSELGTHELSLKGMDADGKVGAEANYQVLVVERSAIDHDMFDFNFPEYRGGGSRTLWATYYYLPEVQSLSSGYPLRKMDGSQLGPVLSHKNWCFAAMEGSVRVVGADGSGVTYNYAGTADGYEVNCKRYFSWNVSRTKFKVARGEYGDGVRRYKLVPYRTIAVDRTRIPYGSIVYIPSARGNEIILPDGSKTIHDGYFFAGDTGGAIKGAHIDVFIGVAPKNPFKWVKSYEGGTFKAYVVTDPVITEKLTNIHVK